MWLPECPYSPALNGLHPEVTHTSSAYSQLSRSSQWLLRYLSEGHYFCHTEHARVTVDLKGAFLGKVSKVTSYGRVVLMFHLCDQSPGGRWARAVGALAAHGHLVCLSSRCISESLSPITWASPKHEPGCRGEEPEGPDFSHPRDVTPAMSQMTIIFTVMFQNIFC